jgi:proteasome accessory factor C
VVPPQARPQDLSAGVFRPSSELPLITLRIGRGERWITEYYPCERIESDGERWEVSLRVTDLGWARRFVLGLGPDVTVVAPAELAEQVRDAAVAALEAYATPVSPGADPAAQAARQ